MEGEGRLSSRCATMRRADRYLPVSWDEAFAEIGRELRALASPDEAEFYTSGRASNEAALPLPALRPRLRHQQLPRLFEHVPRGERRGAHRGDRHRQGHGAARGFREGGRDLLRRPEPRHQPPADARRPAPGRRARGEDRSCSIPCASAAWSASPTRRTPSRCSAARAGRSPATTFSPGSAATWRPSGASPKSSSPGTRRRWPRGVPRSSTGPSSPTTPPATRPIAPPSRRRAGTRSSTSRASPGRQSRPRRTSTSARRR